MPGRGRFVWRHRTWETVAGEGPARRLGRWWRGETAIRDYWQVTAVPARSPDGIPDGIPDGAGAGPPLASAATRQPAPAKRWSVHGLMG